MSLAASKLSLPHLPIIERFERREKQALIGPIVCQFEPVLGQRYQARSHSLVSRGASKLKALSRSLQIIFFIFPWHPARLPRFMRVPTPVRRCNRGPEVDTPK
jgi:hypothetical protein